MQFTDKELRTFYGLVKYPDLNDRELSDIVDVKLSTVTAIRRRLQEGGVFKEVTLPCMESLGSEIIFLGYGPFGIGTHRSHQDMSRKLSDLCGSIFLMGDAGDYGFFMGLANNYTEIKGDLDRFNHYLSHNGILVEPWSYALFPFAVSKLLNCFDFSPVLCHTYGLKDKMEDVKLEFERPKLVELTPKERTVLKGLVRNPGISDSSLAEKIDVSRQAISDMRRRFVADGVIRNLRIPDLSSIGCELMTLTHAQFNPRCQLNDRKEGVKLMLRESPHAFAVSGSFETIMLHVHKGYPELDEAKDKVITYYKMHDFLRGDPRISIFLSPKMKYPRWFAFDQILQKTIGD